MVRTKFDAGHKRYYCSAGSPYETEYQEEIDKKSGNKHLVPVGKKNIYEMIQQDLEASKIENIIHKLAMGDLSVLKQAQLTYVDEEDYPKSLMEAQNIVVRAKAEFDKFPAEVRELFHNSPEEYVSQIGTEEFFKKMAPYNDDIAKHKKEESDRAFNSEVEQAVRFNKAVNAAMEDKTE